MDESTGGAGGLKLLGGRLSLDFANTVDDHGGEHPIEKLTSYADLVAWSRLVGILGEDEAESLLEKAARRPSDARAALQRAVGLREAIYRIFSAEARGHPPLTADLETFNAGLSKALARSRVIPTVEGFAWDWAENGETLDRVLWPVVRDAAELLTSEDLDRVGECDGDDCGWLFLDTSRNRRRRWCSMEDCGNRAKARRHYKRYRAASEAPGEKL